MATPENESPLPKVGKADFLDLVFEDVVDPEHQGRWERFSASNPVLAREILRRVHAQTHGQNLSPPEQQKLVIDTLTFAFSALEHAARRLKAEQSAAFIAADDDVDDEGQQPSA